MRPTFKIVISLLIYSLLFSACSTPKKSTDLEKVFRKVPNTQYVKIINDYTANHKEYSGFYNTYDATVTINNTVVREALLQREGFFMQWEAPKAQNEREKSLQKMSSSSEFFLSLFTPKSAHNDLHKEASMWKIYLEVNGVRYKGKVKKHPKNFVQLQNLYPYHTRFSKGYTVTFNVPMSSIEDGSSLFLLTSSLGNTTFKY